DSTLSLHDALPILGKSRKEVLGLIGGIGIIGMIFFVSNISNSEAMDLPLNEVGEIAAWTPLAAATGWATGSIAKLLIALVTLLLGVWLWWRDIEESPARVKNHEKADLTLPLVPHTP